MSVRYLGKPHMTTHSWGPFTYGITRLDCVIDDKPPNVQTGYQFVIQWSARVSFQFMVVTFRDP